VNGVDQHQTINEFEIGKRVYGHFLVLSADPREQNGKRNRFMDIMLMDRTGNVNAKIWDCTPNQEARIVKNIIVYAAGIVTEYKGSPQLKIEQIGSAPETFTIMDFVQCAPVPIDTMKGYVWNKVHDMTRDEIREIVTWSLEQAGDKFDIYPAAKGMHHNVYSGLLYHVYTMLQAAEALLQVYPWLNADLLFAGIVLHDIEKINEMIAENGSVSGRTRRGELMGHVIQGVILMERAAAALGLQDSEVIDVLQHMILSHHDKPEWGSPVRPMLPEAFMLHMIDNIDAKMYAINQALTDRKEGEPFTDKVRALEGQKMYFFES
jgi:3'-5' exoribonuclease